MNHDLIILWVAYLASAGVLPSRADIAVCRHDPECQAAFAAWHYCRRQAFVLAVASALVPPQSTYVDWLARQWRGAIELCIQNQEHQC